MLDGKALPAYDGISQTPLVFSADAEHLTYFAQTKGKWRTVVNGRPGPAFDNVFSAVAFSDDGAHHAYSAKRGDRYVVVVDGEEGPEFEDIPAGPTIRSDAAEYLAVMEGTLYRVRHPLKQSTPSSKPAQ